MNRKNMLGLALVGAIAMTAVVMADVEWDPATGIGFVGKGDVQSAFGWNNEEAQTNIPYISFSATLVQTVTQGCYTTGANQVFVTNRVGTRTAGPVGVDWEARIHQQIDGIFLLGYTSDPDDLEWSDIDWEGPNNGCPDDTHPKFAPTFGTISAELFVTFDGTTVQIWPEDE